MSNIRTGIEEIYIRCYGQESRMHRATQVCRCKIKHLLLPSRAVPAGKVGEELSDANALQIHSANVSGLRSFRQHATWRIGYIGLTPTGEGVTAPTVSRDSKQDSQLKPALSTEQADQKSTAHRSTLARVCA